MRNGSMLTARAGDPARLSSGCVGPARRSARKRKGAGSSWFEYDEGVSQDDTEAISWYRRAAAQGDSTALLFVVRMYVNGRGCRTAILKQLSGTAVPPKKVMLRDNWLGLRYTAGWDVPEDDAEGIKWYRRAADQGYAEAMHTLALKYTTGTDVLKDEAEGFAWYRRAAKQGHAKAQYYVGHIYETGFGHRYSKRHS